jgi:prephenate dehydrogenase
VIGLGLIGGSVALALRERGGGCVATTPTRPRAPLSEGLIVDRPGSTDAEITFVAVPVLAIADR